MSTAYLPLSLLQDAVWRKDHAAPQRLLSVLGETEEDELWLYVWRTIWEQNEHVVCRLKHTERLVEYQNKDGKWVKEDVQKARQRLELLASARTEMVVRRGGQKKAKRQPVTAEIRACPIRLTYESNVRREGPRETLQKELWLLEVIVPRTTSSRGWN